MFILRNTYINVYSFNYRRERRAARGSCCPRCGSASWWWRSCSSASRSSASRSSASRSSASRSSASRSSASSALWCLLPLARLVNVSSPMFDMSNVLPTHRVANMVKSTLLWHSTLFRPLPELWPGNFPVKVRSLATRKNNHRADSMRAYAGLYFECLLFKNIWIILNST